MDFEDKQAQVLAKGAAKRGEYSPRPGSAPLRAYNYWLSEGGEPPVRENFCHYWRVVVFWAPLFWLAVNVLLPFFTNPLFRAEWAGTVKVTGGFGRFVGRTVHRVSNKRWEQIGNLLFKVFFGLLILAGLATFVLAASTNWVGTALVLGGVAVFALVVATVAYFVGNAIDKKQKAEDAARDALIEKWYNGELDEYPSLKKAKKGPGPVKRFFKAIGEFLVLLVQIVRVNKWKICPLVEIPVNEGR